MAGKLFFKALTVLVVLAAVVLFILGILLPATFFAIFTVQLSMILLAAGLGVVSLLKAITSKANVFLIIAALLITGAIIYTGINYKVLPEDITWLYVPIGAALLLAFLFFRYVFNIRRWDAGDNEKLGYKNYKVRQAEKEKADLDEQISDLEKEIREKEKQQTILKMDIEDKLKQKDNIKTK